MSLIRKAGGVGLWTLVSRFFGFLRDTCVAFFLGAGVVNDAFIVAFRLPNLFRTIFGEGAFSAAFVPLFSKVYHRNGHAAAEKLASHVQSYLFIILVAFSVLMMYFMPEIIAFTVAGYDGSSYAIELSTDFGRIIFPYIIFISYMAFYGGILNSLGRFFAFSSAPIILNLVQIIVIMLVPRGEAAGYALSYGALVAGFLEMLWVYIFMRRAGVRLVIVCPVMTPEIKILLKRIAPGIIGSSIAQINVWIVSTLFASFVPAGISYLYYADRIYQLPLALIGTALGTVLLGNLSALAASGETSEVYRMQNEAIAFSMLLALPSAVGIFALSEEIVALLFRRGQFDDIAVSETAAALKIFSLGLPAFILSKVLGNSFFAAGDTKTPVKIAFVALIINMVVSWYLLPHLKHVSIALGSVISAWLSVVAMAVFLIRRSKLQIKGHTYKYVSKILVACSCMYIGIVTLPMPDVSRNFVTLLQIATGGALYIAIGIVGLNLHRIVRP